MCSASSRSASMTTSSTWGATPCAPRARLRGSERPLARACPCAHSSSTRRSLSLPRRWKSSRSGEDLPGRFRLRHDATKDRFLSARRRSGSSSSSNPAHPYSTFQRRFESQGDSIERPSKGRSVSSLRVIGSCARRSPRGAAGLSRQFRKNLRFRCPWKTCQARRRPRSSNASGVRRIGLSISPGTGWCGRGCCASRRRSTFYS